LEIDLHSELRTGGERVWESVTTFLIRGRFGGEGAPVPMARAPEPVGTVLAKWTPPFGGSVRFGWLTGDDNGIHLFGSYARAMGFHGAFFHSQRVLGGALAQLPASAAGGWSPVRLDVWLKGPVYYGRELALTSHSANLETTFAVALCDRDQAASRPSIVGRLRPALAGETLDATPGAD
jgi:hypothetical protein